ncbi:MAG: hypothetical protein U9R21_01525 [Candidatus Thermoplasmatota archaeon]|nr:hypothetical protein [Candidatus Thermoplasmatota archaeon]
MNSDYESVAKEIDEMLIERQIDKLLSIKKQKKNEKEWNGGEPKKSKDFAYRTSIHQNTKEEIIELPKRPEKEIVELYEEPEKMANKKKAIIWKNS